MLRVTVELVPFGSEELAKTIAEVCIANVGGGSIANYEAAGYESGNGKISEVAMKFDGHDRNEGALKLVGEILLAPRYELTEVELAENLIAKTRLMLGENNE